MLTVEYEILLQTLYSINTCCKPSLLLVEASLIFVSAHSYPVVEQSKGPSVYTIVLIQIIRHSILRATIFIG